MRQTFQALDSCMRANFVQGSIRDKMSDVQKACVGGVDFELVLARLEDAFDRKWWQKMGKTRAPEEIVVDLKNEGVLSSHKSETESDRTSQIYYTASPDMMQHQLPTRVLSSEATCPRSRPRPQFNQPSRRSSGSSSSTRLRASIARTSSWALRSLRSQSR